MASHPLCWSCWTIHPRHIPLCVLYGQHTLGEAWKGQGTGCGAGEEESFGTQGEGKGWISLNGQPAQAGGGMAVCCLPPKEPKSMQRRGCKKFNQIWNARKREAIYHHEPACLRNGTPRA